MEIAAVVVNYNTRDLLRSCLESIRTEGIAEVVVVDNASTDGSPGMVRSEFPAARLIANRHNPGYGGGANQGIAATSAPYALLLNSDTLLGPGAPARLAAWLDDHPRCAIAGPRLLNPDGTLQSSCFPDLTPFNVLALNTWLNRLVRPLPRFRPTWRGTPSRSGHWVKGAALAIRREAFEAVGGFDESYFMYAEELDLCRRLNAAGWEVHYTPEATVVHVEGASTEQDRHAMAERLFASLEHYYRRHHPERLPRLRRVMKVVLLERIARDRWKGWRYPERRARLAEDIAVWRRMMGPHPPAPSPGPPSTPAPGEGETYPSPLSPLGPLRPLGPWRFLLPARRFQRLVLLGAPPGLAEQLHSLAEQVSEVLEPADAIAVLRGAKVSPAEVARCLAPGGWLYWESYERRSLRSPWAVPGRAVARLRSCGLKIAGVWAVWPSFERPEAWVPTEALGWFGRTLYPERWPGLALRVMPLRGAVVTRFFAITASAGPAQETPRPVLLSHGAERVILLFPGEKVVKVPLHPAFNGKTAREQRVLAQIRGLLDEVTARALPRPLGTERYGEAVASVESYAPGRPMILGRGGERDLRLAAGWLTRFHLQTLLRREPWDGREVEEAFASFRATPEEQALFDLALARSRELRGVPFPIVWRHRDFTPWNLLRDGRGRLSVLDWEGAQPGLALCDLLHFAGHWNELAAGAVTPEARLRAFSLGTPASCRQATRYCDQLGIDHRFIPLLLVYTRVEIALRHPGRTFDAEYVSALAERVPEELRRAA